MFSLLINSAELVLPSIFAMADEPDQILLFLTFLPKESFSRYTFVFFFQHNNQFVDSMYNESLP